MNLTEKRSLWSFLSIYVGSSVVCLSLALITYYRQQIETLNRQYSMEMVSMAYKLQADIFKSYMNKGHYSPKKLDNPKFRYGLYGNNSQVIFSNLSTSVSHINEELDQNSTHTFHIHQLDKKEIPIKYIIIETNQSRIEKEKLTHFMLFILLGSTVFILFIGYLLSRLLLKPFKQKLYDIDQFIKDSAHELNTPLAVLMTSVSTLKQGKRTEKMLRYISSSSKQISHIFNDLHFSVFHRQTKPVRSNFDLAVLCQESIDFFEDIALTKSITIQHHLDCSPIYMDKNQTQRIINNLLSNAIKYSHYQSNIHVTLKEYQLSVQDFGIGISDNDKKHILKRYKRGTNNQEGGLGIGLDIVNRICKEFNIILTIQSSLDQGSVFKLDFSSCHV